MFKENQVDIPELFEFELESIYDDGKEGKFNESNEQVSKVSKLLNTVNKKLLDEEKCIDLIAMHDSSYKTSIRKRIEDTNWFEGVHVLENIDELITYLESVI